MDDLWIALLIALWLVVLLLAFLLAGALRQLGILQMRLGNDPGALITDSGLDRGTEAPDFQAIDAQTSAVVGLSALPREARLLTFLSPNCLSCREIVPHINEVMETRKGEFDFLVICQGDAQSCRGFAETTGLKARMLVDFSGDIGHAYEVTVTPFVYVVDYEGRVLIRGVANDWRQLESLLEQEGTLERGMVWTSVGEAVESK